MPRTNKPINKNHSWFGRKHSEESKREISSAMMGEKNHRFGKKVSEEMKRKQSLALKGTKMGSKNHTWKGDKVGYSGIHYYIRRRKSKPQLCEDCKKVPPRELSSNDHKYSRNPKKWEWLCKPCHAKKDKKLNNKKYQGMKKNG